MHQNDLILAPRKCFCLCDLLILAEKNVKVSGFDDNLTPLTDLLNKNGIIVSDDFTISKKKLTPNQETLIVYTSALDETHKVLNYFFSNHFQVMKRAKVLGLITKDTRTIAIAGTHGKTTTCSMLSHILRLTILLVCKNRLHD